MTGRAAKAADFTALCGLLVLAFFVYLRSPDEGVFSDPKYALLVSQSLRERASWDVSPHLPWLKSSPEAVAEAPAPPYQLRRVGDRLVYFYPAGTSVLSLPFVVALDALGFPILDDNRVYIARRERQVQKILAALLTAITVATLFRLARRELPLLPALVVAATSAFGSNLWSTASRSMWSHTWTALLCALMLLELLRWEQGGRRRPIWLGLLLVSMVWVRPTSAVIAGSVTVFVALRQRAALLPLMLVGTVGCLAYVTATAFIWGGSPTPYSAQAKQLGQGSLIEGVVGQLFSPSRGLLVASPVLVAVVWLLFRHGIPSGRRPLVQLTTFIVAAYVTLYSLWGWWAGGGTAGPRFLTDIVPCLSLLGVLAWRSWRDSSPDGRARPWLRLAGTAMASILILASVTGQYGWVHYHRVIVRRVVGPPERRDRGPQGLADEFSAASWRAGPQMSFARKMMESEVHRFLPNAAVSLRVKPDLLSPREPVFVEVESTGSDLNLAGSVLVEVRDDRRNLLAREELPLNNGRGSGWLYPRTPKTPGPVTVRAAGEAPFPRSRWRSLKVPVAAAQLPVEARFREGLHGRESSAWGELRWTSELAVAELGVRNEDALLHLRYRCGDERPRTALLIVASMPPVELSCGDNEPQTLRIPVSHSAWGGAPALRVEIRVSPGFRPAELGTPGDSRTLGLQLLQLAATDRH